MALTIFIASGCATTNRALTAREFAAIQSAQDVVLFHAGSPKLEFWDTQIQGRENAGSWAAYFSPPVGTSLQLAALAEAQHVGEKRQASWGLTGPVQRIRDHLLIRLRESGLTKIRVIEGLPNHVGVLVAPIGLGDDNPKAASFAVRATRWLIAADPDMKPNFRMVYFVTLEAVRGTELTWATTARCWSKPAPLEQFEADSGAMLREAVEEVARVCAEYLARQVLSDSK